MTALKFIEQKMKKKLLISISDIKKEVKAARKSYYDLRAMMHGN